VKIIGNISRCSGHGRCHEAAPDIYQLDDDGYLLPIAFEVPAHQREDALAGLDACPEGAIRSE
jgi:ferredoxin